MSGDDSAVVAWIAACRSRWFTSISAVSASSGIVSPSLGLGKLLHHGAVRDNRDLARHGRRSRVEVQVIPLEPEGLAAA